MKCGKCGNNDAVFYYRQTINGKTTEKHLCSECAKEEGFTRAFDREEFFSPFHSLMDRDFDPLGDFFGDRDFSRLASRVMAPVFTMPRIEISWEPEKEQSDAEPVKEEKDSVLEERRKLNSLRHQLREAVRKEDFEQAIVLRDQIKDLENKK